MTNFNAKTIIESMSSFDLKKIKFIMEASKIQVESTSENKLIQIKINGLLDIEDLAFGGDILNREVFEETLNQAIFSVTAELAKLCNNDDFSDINIFETILNHKKSSQE